MMPRYSSDVKLGERYRDDQTGFKDVATAVYFFQHACERVTLEAYDAERKEVKEQTFDAPRLTHIASGKTATTPRPGGPARETGVRARGGKR
jgi:hypothetical protein